MSSRGAGRTVRFQSEAIANSRGNFARRGANYARRGTNFARRGTNFARRGARAPGAIERRNRWVRRMDEDMLRREANEAMAAVVQTILTEALNTALAVAAREGRQHVNGSEFLEALSEHPLMDLDGLMPASRARDTIGAARGRGAFLTAARGRGALTYTAPNGLRASTYTATAGRGATAANGFGALTYTTSNGLVVSMPTATARRGAMPANGFGALTHSATAGRGATATRGFGALTSMATGIRGAMAGHGGEAGNRIHVEYDYTPPNRYPSSPRPRVLPIIFNDLSDISDDEFDYDSDASSADGVPPRSDGEDL